jgi:hypothetical protein
MAKRSGEHEVAAEIWKELTLDADWRVAASEELASFHERRRKDSQTALKFARQAIAALGKRTSADRLAGQAAGDLRRFERLKKKIERLEKRLEKAAMWRRCCKGPVIANQRVPEIAGWAARWPAVLVAAAPGL